MTSRSRKARTRSGARPSPTPGRNRRGLLIGLLVVVLGGVAVVLGLRARQEEILVPAAPDPLAGIHPREAYLTAERLQREGRNLDAIPYYRRGLEGLQDDFYEIHFGYAAALRNATVETRVHRGQIVPVTRSSMVRVQMLGESLREFDRALALATTPRQAVEVVKARAQLLSNWGLGWDAFTMYRNAQHLDPTGELARRGDNYMDLLAHPEHYASWPSLDTPPPGWRPPTR